MKRARFQPAVAQALIDALSWPYPIEKEFNITPSRFKDHYWLEDDKGKSHGMFKKDCLIEIKDNYGSDNNN